MTTEQRALTREEALHILRAHRAELRERFGVVELALFGSTVRNEARPDSDVDILVSFDDRSIGWTEFFDTQAYLETLLEHSVDLVTRRSVRAELRPTIEADAINV